MNKPCLLVFVRDLYFKSRIEGIAEAKKIDYYFATQGEQLSQLAKNLAPFMILLDLSGLDSQWLFRHISQIRNSRTDLPIAVLISHVQEAVRQRAESYGCNFVFTKSELLKKLPETIEKALRKTF